MATTTIWRQCWKSADCLDLECEQEDRWKIFISNLKEGYIRIREEVDSMDYTHDRVSVIYTTKVDYKVLLLGIEQ